MLVQHGAYVPLVPVTRGQDSVTNLRLLGDDMTYSEVDTGYEIHADGLRNLAAFFNQRILKPIRLA